MRPLPLVFMFSGQGSQHPDMGRELFEHEPVFRSVLLELDALVRQESGHSVLASLYGQARSAAESFDALLLTHPALFSIELALARTLIAKGLQPDITLGVSLGTFVAAVVSGCLDLVDALRLVLKQADAVVANCERGGMVAVLADAAVHASEVRAFGELAAVTSNRHFVVAAAHATLAPLEAYLRQKALAYQRLPVQYAFHSRWMDAAAAPFLAAVGQPHLRIGPTPLVCCARAGTLHEIAPAYFWEVGRAPIRFAAAIAHLERGGPHRYIDVGPSGSLAALLKFCLPAAAARTQFVLSPFGGDLRRLHALTSSIGPAPARAEP